MITYGYDAKEYDDPLVDLIDRTMDHFSESSQPGSFLVDVLPIRKWFPFASLLSFLPSETVKYVPAWFPGAGFKRKATIWRNDVMDASRLPFEWNRKQTVSLGLIVSKAVD